MPGEQNPSSKKTEVRGVFSSQEVRKVGTGTTTRKTVQKTFWFVEQRGDSIECQPLNANYVPTGAKRKISMEELITKFSPEPEFYLSAVYPKMQELQQSVDNGDSHREKEKTSLLNTNIPVRSRLMKKMCEPILASVLPIWSAVT